MESDSNLWAEVDEQGRLVLPVQASEFYGVKPGTRVHLGFPDPAKTTGTDEEVLQSFRQVRDQIAESIPALLRESARR